MSADRNTRIGRRGLGLPPMSAQHGGGDVEQKSGHYITSRAVSFSDTLRPMSLILAPLPFDISIPVTDISIFIPVVVSILMPPTPGVSLMVMVAASEVYSRR